MKILLQLVGWLVFIGLWFLVETEWLNLVRAPFLRYLNSFAGFYFFFMGFSSLMQFLQYVYRRRKKLGAEQKDNIIAGSHNIYYLVMLLVLFMTVLSLFGINLSSLLTSISIFAAALAILSKDYISNIISGMMIAFSNEVDLGDVVKIGQQKGKVMSLSLSKLVILNDDDDLIYIPNNTVFLSEIVNYTKRDIKKTSIEFEMDLQYVRRIPNLEQDLIMAIENYHEWIQEDSFILKVEELKKDAVIFKFQYILQEPNRKLEQDIRRLMIRHIVHIVKEHQNNVIP
ncbi:mechanosensitive ion channel [Saprospira sp. CCB-QB6]|uniref:mechanosensitive ion channel family protein n=1 Tax=Saprospira sp. CCB-QB6 TaxID=3023936 RepID=UPI002349DCFE|nr:mechanosensitive ion channel domain-containing protein [Saprospira sp. CCB-QB6]WCL80493.1 mechanosensitive ion channel [Saprospira sp. CCB-QB6]